MFFLATLFLVTFFVVQLPGQDTVLPLNFNPALWYQCKSKVTTSSARGEALSNYLVESDSKSLPFVDDFSKPKQRTFNFPQNYVFDSIQNASGPCVDALLLSTVTKRFHKDTSWNYTYNLLTKQIDSSAKLPVTFGYYASTGKKCLTFVSYTYKFWPEYYRYTFDTITGEKKDSTLVTDDNVNPDTLITYVPVIYRAKLDTSWLWEDNFAFINNNFPVFPPTLGVATLDGLNEYGRPHDPFIQPNSYGNADVLTSVPLDLSSYSESDSLYLSFFYQPMGLGDYPDRNDSLIVEFKNEYTDKFDVVWKRGGYNNIPTAQDMQFKQVVIPFPSKQIPIRNYFYNGFQFRFRNKASITGNNDHWHIDYVRLDKNRSINDTIIEDIAIIQPPPSILKRYYTMPARQFSGNDDLSDTFNIYVRNLNYYSNSPATNFQGFVQEKFPSNSQVFSAPLQTFNAGYSNIISRNPQNDFIMPASLGNSDSVALHIKEWIEPMDFNRSNDTVSSLQIFYNELAYDDGTAEKAYGLFGDPGKVKKFAYEFILNKADTLTGFKVFFTNIDENVGNLVFRFNIWDTIALQQFNPPGPIWESKNTTPQYIDSMNGFAVYRLDTALIVDKKIYFGWTQDDFRNIQIGYDRNSTKGCGHYYVYTNATWKKSNICQTLPGSVMIHLLFGDTSKIKPSHVSDLRKERWALSIYPNPTSGMLNIYVEDEMHHYDIAIYDLMGKLRWYKPTITQRIDIRELEDGLYFLKITNQKNGASVLRRIIKKSE
ncbi:MAG: T9SS type A sorting domain-containing protein [Chitinophagales bacterium]|nr:T9SS type A sorting domain-containing protein [Chitinophagales bacterium]